MTIPTDSNREQRCSCLSKLLIISNESPVLNFFSPFSLLSPFLFLILFFLSAFSSFFFIPFVVPIESNFTVQQDRYVRPSNQQYSDFLKYLSFPMSSGSIMMVSLLLTIPFLSFIIFKYPLIRSRHRILTPFPVGSTDAVAQFLLALLSLIIPICRNTLRPRRH